LTDDEFERWLLDFAYGSDGSAALRSVGSRYRLSGTVLDDLRQDWVMSILGTLGRRRAAGHDQPMVDDAEGARRYAWRVLGNRAVDLLRSPSGREADWRFPVDDVQDDPLERLADPRPGVEATVLAGNDLDGLRHEVAARLHRGQLRCPGCHGAIVAGAALAVIDGFADVAPSAAPATQTAGGSTELDELIYDGLVRVAPDRIQADDRGRMSDAARALKSRCGRCVRRLLVELLGASIGGGNGHTDEAALAEQPSEPDQETPHG
jgi:hypothetical protein